MNYDNARKQIVIKIVSLLAHSGKILHSYHTHVPSDLMHITFLAVTQLLIWSWMKSPPLDNSRMGQIIINQISDVLLYFQDRNQRICQDHQSLFPWVGQCIYYAYGTSDLFHLGKDFAQPCPECIIVFTAVCCIASLWYCQTHRH